MSIEPLNYKAEVRAARHLYGAGLKRSAYGLEAALRMSRLRGFGSLLGLLAFGMGWMGCTKSEPISAASEADAARPPFIYAASAHLRVIDLEEGRVVARFDMQRAVRGFAVSRDGSRVYMAASDGVRVFNGHTHQLVGHWTKNPARSVELDASETRLFVLEHRVRIDEQGNREVEPFRLVTLDAERGEVVDEEEVGPRVLYARPALGRVLKGVRVSEASKVSLVEPSRVEPAGIGRQSLALSLAAYGPLRIRDAITLYGQGLYLPVEGVPSRIVRIDLSTGKEKSFGLGGQIPLRGLAVTPDGGRALVNIGRSLWALDLNTEKITNRLDLGAPHVGLSLSADGRTAVLAQTVDETGGSVTVVDLERFEISAKIHLDDISPWAITAVPRG